MTEPEPRSQAEWLGALAQDAFARGERAWAEGDLHEALRWLERAHRIAPQDLAASMALAAAMLRVGDPHAVALFASVAEQADTREAWLGAAASHHALGAHGDAARIAEQALSRHAIATTLGVDDLLTFIARDAGTPGWCCLDDGNNLRHRLLGGGSVVVAADGRTISGPIPLRATNVSVTSGGLHLLGSPLLPGMIRRIEGFVDVRDGGLEGWAWHPASPETVPVLVVRSSDGRRVTRVRAEADAPATPGALTRHRAFRVPAHAIAGFMPPLRVQAAGGPDLLGSPLDPGASKTPHAAVHETGHDALASAAADSRRRVVVVIPAYRDAALTLACIAAVADTTPSDVRIVVVDDATPEPALARGLDALRAARRIRLVRHRVNRGFPVSANAGLRAALALPGARDFVLLNSDTRPTRGWLDRLRAAAHSAADIGTATPLSNDASILSYPHPDAPAPMPSPREALRLARQSARANGAVTVDIPTAVGFCMYIRRECLVATGLLREDVFAQGYGEENDFCLRARQLGWRHVAVPGAFVAHAGGRSFGAARAHLMRRNLAVLERLYPGYHASIAAFAARDPLAAARRRLDVLRFRTAAMPGGAVVLITHDSGGGVERAVRARAVAIRAERRRPIVLRPVIDRAADGEDGRRYRPGFCAVGDPAVPAAWPNLIYRLPDERDALMQLLARERVAHVEIHNMLGHDPWLLDLAAALGVPCDIHVHDYAWFCPRITLVNAAGRYCGEPVDAVVCDACVAAAGSRIEEVIPAATLRARSARHLAAARSVVAPSRDAAARIRRHFPKSRLLVQPHEDGPALLPPPAISRVRRSSDERLVCVVGGIGVEKGYDVLLACARDAEARRLPLAFTVVGHTVDDRALFATGRVFVTGAYREEEGVSLIRAQAADIAFVPSIWPETWCYTLGLAWHAGLRVAAFDIGAPAERIRGNGQGVLLPLGLPPNSINDALLAVLAVAGNECGTHHP